MFDTYIFLWNGPLDILCLEEDLIVHKSRVWSNILRHNTSENSRLLPLSLKKKDFFFLDPVNCRFSYSWSDFLDKNMKLSKDMLA